MGRPPKDPDHPLTRLRKAISTPTKIVTRELLAKRTGVSAPTIRDIETRKLGLSEAVARRIMLATGVSTQSLLRNETPLKDITGRELSPKSEADVISELSYKHEINMFDMLTAVVKAAKEKKRVTVFYNLFSEWLPQAAASIGVIPTVEKVLTNDLGLFDTVHVPEAFQPTDPKIKKRWDESQRELLMAIVERAGGIEKVTRDPSAYVKAYLDEFKSRRAKQPMRLSSSS